MAIFKYFSLFFRFRRKKQQWARKLRRRAKPQEKRRPEGVVVAKPSNLMALFCFKSWFFYTLPFQGEFNSRIPACWVFEKKLLRNDESGIKIVAETTRRKSRINKGDFFFSSFFSSQKMWTRSRHVHLSLKYSQNASSVWRFIYFSSSWNFYVQIPSLFFHFVQFLSIWKGLASNLVSSVCVIDFEKINPCFFLFYEISKEWLFFFYTFSRTSKLFVAFAVPIIFIFRKEFFVAWAKGNCVSAGARRRGRHRQ